MNLFPRRVHAAWLPRLLRPAIASACAALLVALVVMSTSAADDDGHWILLRPSGRAPEALRYASYAHDANRNWMMVFGGRLGRTLAGRLDQPLRPSAQTPEVER